MKKVLIIIVVILAALLLGRNTIIKMGAKTAITAVTGLPVNIDKFHVGLFQSVIEIKGLQLLNPEGFDEKVMMDIPEIHVDYRLGAFVSGDVHLEEVRFHLKDFNVIKKADGTSNLDFLKALQDTKKPKEEKEEKPKEEKSKKKVDIKIDNLSLIVDQAQTIVYKESGEPEVNTYKIGLKEDHKDIDNLNSVILMIVLKIAMKSPAIIAAGNIDMGPLGDVLSGSLGKATELLGTSSEAATKALGDATGAVTDTTGKLKGLIKSPFGKN